MSDEEYSKKLETLQQYIPFLDNMIQQLRDPTKKNREQQLTKMQSLHAMITDKKKKLKLETLIRCEDVISKLYEKVHNRPINAPKKSIDSPALTPASPSPPRDIVPQQPLTIPTERLDGDRPKIDVYSSAGESLINQRSYHRLALGTRVPDMSKPPISLEDLKTLEDDVQEKINENSLKSASLHELKDLRERLTEQIQLEDIKTKSPQKSKKEETINTTVRNNLTLTKKTIQPPDKTKDKEKVKEKIEPPKASPTTKAKDTKAEVSSEATTPKKEAKSIILNLKPKILKEPASIFGSILSNIDDQILEGKKKKDERRSSLTGKDERRMSDGGKDQKSKSSDSKHSEKKKEERRSSSSNKDEKKSDEKKSPDPKKISGKSSSGDKNKSPNKDSKSKDYLFSLSGKKTFEQEELLLKQKLEKPEDTDPSNAIEKDCSKERTPGSTPNQAETDATKDKAVTSRISVKKDLELKSNKEPFVVDNKEESANKIPVYKRLADKYNPKPRKQTVDADVDKAVTDSIEEKMKTSPPKIPLINQLPEPVPPPASLLICSQAEPEQPQPTPQLPAVLQNIMNPSTTQLINSVVSHLRQTNAETEAKKAPLLPTPPSLLGVPPMLPTPVPPLMPNQASILGNSPLISPPPREDNFISEYCREAFANDEFGQMNDFGNAQFPNQARPDRLQFEPPQDNRMGNQFEHRNTNYIPPLLGDRFNENFNQNRFTPNNRFSQQYSFNQNNGVDIQPLDYYPPNAPVPANQFNCGPPLLSPEVPHYHNEQKPSGFGMMMNHDVYGGNEEPYWRTEEGRPNWERRDQDFRMNRDPRTYREYREMRESRDPRVARDNRDAARESRDPRINREPRDRDYRDPRLQHRGRDPRDRDERDQSRGRDGRSQSRDFRPSRYDSKFDRMYARTNRDRSRSRSRSRSYNTDTFASPLDSLYSGKEEHRTGKGYGVQNFRIPKIKKEDEGKEKEEEYAKVTSTNEDLEASDNTGCDVEVSDDDDETDKAEVVVENDADQEKPVEEDVKETVVETVSADSPAAEEIDEQPKEDEPKEGETSKVTSSQPAEPEGKPADQTILAQFFANLLGSKNKRDKKTALYSLISTFSDSFSEKELSKITKIIKANDDEGSESSEDEEETKKSLKPDEEKTKDETLEDEKEDTVAKPRPKSRKRIRRISSASPNKEEKNKEKEAAKTPEPEEPESKEEDSVVVTVGERIKSRKRSSITPPKPKKKCRTELDMLHEDIQDMFIRDGVLTASGKRMCRILKDDPSVLVGAQQPKTPVAEEVKMRKKPGPKPKCKIPNAADVKVMKSVRVVIPKMLDSSITQREETPKRILRRSARNVAYAESDDDSSVREETPTIDDDSIIEEGSVREDESEIESSDNEKEKSSQSGETSQKSKLTKRKRGKGWASGVIPSNKKKKKKHLSTEPEESNKGDTDKAESDVDRSFVEPDRNYYSDSLTNKAQSCKLCDYRGRFITTHYKTIHPDSEVLTSRFSPTIAAEAIRDSENNLAKYESIVRMRGGVKCQFRCRFCDFNTQVPPTLFYDHITTHTGEYRHICPMCEFSASSGKTLKVHMQSAHQNANKRVARKSYGHNIIFGYMCGECNYVQLSQKNVEDHINIFHLQKPTVYKINMSTHLDPEIEKICDEEGKTDSNEETTININNKEQPKQDESQPQKIVEKKMPPPQRKKPGPKPKKFKKNVRAATDSDVTDTDSVTSKESEPAEGKQQEEKEASAEKPSPVARRRLTREIAVEEEIIITGRSKRAAKEKAAEKLKSLMEASEGPPRKKSLTGDETRKHEEKKNEVKTTDETQPSSNEEIKESTEPKEDKNSETNTEESKQEKAVEVKPVIKKEVELNVFTCKTDLQEENKKIEQERLQLMDELNKSVGSRTSLNFVDKLCNRLSQSNVVVKQEPQDDLTDSLFPRDTSNKSPLVMPVLEKEKNVTTPTSAATPSPSTVTITQPKKPVLEPEVTQISKPSFDVIQKNDKIITDMIQKLKGKLATVDEEATKSPICVEETDYDSEGPPPLTHVNALVNVKPADGSTKTLLIGGLVRVIKNSESLMFSCLVPPCVFSTENKDAFQAHCKEAHKQSTLNRPSTLCDMCGMEVVSSPECTLLENLFKHTITEHADFISKETQETSKAPGRVLRLRKLSGDALSIIRRDWDEDSNDGNADDVETSTTSADKIENDKENQNVVNNTTVSEVAVSETSEEAPATMAELDMSEDNPFPFKIAGVMSLAEPQPPPLAPIAKPSLQMSSSTQLIVKEAKLTQAELNKPRKTQKAMSKFIASVSDLYKCPHYYCLFSTNFRDFLERHLKAHKVEHDVMIPCVYCDMKTPWEHVPMHIDIRHAHCRFACSYCLYRAVIREYVFLHQDQVHPANDYSVIALPQPKQSKKFAIAEMKGDPKNLCEPYKCTKACNVEFLFENEFKRHLQDVHKSCFVPCGYKYCTNRVQAAKMPNHWSLNHGVSLYQCGYCKMSAGEMKKMYHHFAQFHPGQQPDILIRLLTPMQDGVTLGYGPEAFKQMRKVVNVVLPDPSKPEATTSESPMSVIVPTVQCGKPTTFKTASPFAKTIQVVTTLPQSVKKSVLIPSSKSGMNRTILVSTSSSTSGTSNILLLPSSSDCTTLSGLVMTTQRPIVTSKAPLGDKVTVVSSVSTATTAILSSTSQDIGAEPMPDKDSTAVEETVEQAGTQEVQLSIEPVEHITVGEDAQVGVEDAETGDIDPLCLDADLTDATKNADGFSSGDESELEKSKKTTKMGLLSYQLYRCAFCDISFSNSNDFKKHVTRSLICRNDDGTGKPYVCVHCGKKLKNAHVFGEHIQCHGVLRFSCSLCTNKYPTASQARSHMKTRHNINQTSLTPVNSTKTNIDTDEYVIRPKLVLQPLPPEAPPSEPSTSAASTDNVYTPDQIDKIPMRHILSSSIKCGLCSYSTKVRTNMVRHLQFHSEEKAVSDTAPVNPVPCLEKNEKMFDKMINLASSSHTGSRMGGAKTEGKEKEAENLPEFVLTHCRYVCPAQGCNYLCPEEANLRHHIIALHASETSFTCVHCKRVLTPADADGLIKHFKLHGLQLYKCQYCSFVHNLKHKVERHVTDAHLDLPFTVITVRCLESEPKDQEPTTSQNAAAQVNNRSNKPWRCCMCKYKSVTQQGIEQHVLEKHEIDSQFKCALCTYKSNDKDNFAEHFKDVHNGQTVDIIYAYRKIEEDKEKESETFDTTPLWQRDRPRVRHIRGILFDDSSPVVTKPAKKPAKGAASPAVTPAKAGPSVAGPSGKNTNLVDESIESVVNGTADILRDGPQAVSDDFIDTVNKLAADSGEDVADDKAKDGDVIVIDDDDDLAPMAKNKDSKSSPAAKNRPAKRKIAAEAPAASKAAKISDEVIDLDSGSVDLDLDEFSERSLKLQFGGFGTPLNRQLKCPICNMFKSKKISDFIFHLFMEMKVYRFKCKICSDESITFRYMYKHVKEHSSGENCDNNIIFLPANPRLEAWLQMVIREQSLVMVKNFAPIPDPAANKTFCPQCGIKYQSEEHKDSHAAVHGWSLKPLINWSLKPYGCPKCKFTAYNTKEIEKHLDSVHHLKNVHNFTPRITAPTVADELKSSDGAHMKEVHSSLAGASTSQNVAEPEEDPLRIDVTTEVTSAPNEVADAPSEFTDASNEVKGAPGEVAEGELCESDLVIVTKTDSNVPKETDVFCCEYCPFMTNSETLVLSHITSIHEHMHIRFKTLNRITCEATTKDYVGCSLCNEVGSEIRIRQHHIEKHIGQTFITYRFTCLHCNKKFLKLTGLKQHSNKLHNGIIKYESVLTAPPAPVKVAVAKTWQAKLRIYKCPLCPYERTFPPNALSNVRSHVRKHFKGFACGVCGLRFKTRWAAMSHFTKDHPGTPENIEHDLTVNEELNKTMTEIMRDAKIVAGEQEAPASAPAAAATKNTARKSTSAPFRHVEEEEYSFYGRAPQPVDLTKIMTAVEINGMCLNMSAEKLSKIFDLEAQVEVEDCNLSINLSALFDS